MKKFLLGLMATSLIFTAGCFKKPDNSPAIIKVNDQNITENQYKEEFNKDLKASPLGQQNLNIDEPKNKLFKLIIQNTAINKLIINSLIDQEAQKRNIKISDKDVDTEIDKVTTQLGGKKQLDAALKQHNLNKDQFKENIISELKIKKLSENSVGAIKVSDSETKAFYEKNKASKFTNPDLVKAKHILIAVNQKDIVDVAKAKNPNISNQDLQKMLIAEDTKAKAKATGILNILKKNPNRFDEMAKKNSDDTATAQKGGDLGYFSKKDMVPDFSKVAFTIKPNTVSDLIRSPFGYHIIIVTDRKKAGVAPYDQVKGDIKTYIEKQKQMEVTYKIIEGLKNSSKIVYVKDEYNVDKIEAQIKELMKKQQKAQPASLPKK